MMTLEQKTARIIRAKQHAAADRLISGAYSTTDGTMNGCSVGCDAIDIHGHRYHYDDPHKLVADHDGTPEWLEHLRDRVFEGLPQDKRSWWHVRLAKSLPVGRDWQPYYHAICVGLIDMNLRHADTWAVEYKQQVLDAVHSVRALHVANSKDETAWTAAWAAAASAAYIEIAEMIIAAFETTTKD